MNCKDPQELNIGDRIRRGPGRPEMGGRLIDGDEGEIIDVLEPEKYEGIELVRLQIKWDRKQDLYFPFSTRWSSYWIDGQVLIWLGPVKEIDEWEDELQFELDGMK